MPKESAQSQQPEEEHLRLLYLRPLMLKGPQIHICDHVCCVRIFNFCASVRMSTLGRRVRKMYTRQMISASSAQWIDPYLIAMNKFPTKIQ